MERVTELGVCLQRALARRERMIETHAATGTDCYRLLHGTQEGAPGVTIDRYGEVALIQSFHEPLPSDSVALVQEILDDSLPSLEVIYSDRSSRGSRVRNRLSPEQRMVAERERIVRERGVLFHFTARHRGHDPWLFLDLRPTREAIAGESSGKSVLNLFAYTCTAGVSAAVAGATRVLNVDFAKSSLAVGAANAELNAVGNRSTQLASDFFPAVRQLAGIRQSPVDRGRRLPAFPRIDQESFDLVLLDPPPFAKSRFGVVDLTRDYAALLKPALGTVAERGTIYCTNNVARVDEQSWHSILRRCVSKHGRSIRSFDVIRPGEDFPSSDERPPLKVVRIGL